MRAVDILRAKRHGQPLSAESIRTFIRGFTEGSIPDYQASALLMAICISGMNTEETMSLTKEMLASGRELDFTHLDKPKIDKHSTGGVGDKTSLVVAPLAAACGLAVPMISGRGLGHTGGTLDKLESIPGFRVHLSESEISSIVERVGCAIVGQTENIAPADKKLYALRDVTSTVESVPLITASILSKKLAEGIEGIVFDVKLGTGAYMKDMVQARDLAHSLIETTLALGRRAVAVISDMSQPLGLAVGNALEVSEAIETLKGGGPSDHRTLCIALVAHMLTVGDESLAHQQGLAKKTATDALNSGRALEVFKKMLEAQGGDARILDEPKILPSAPHQRAFRAVDAGFIASMDTEAIGNAAMCLGAGRRTVDEAIAPSAGLRFHHKLGSEIAKGETILTLYAEDEAAFDEAQAHLTRAISISSSPPPTIPLIHTVEPQERTS